MKFKTNSIKSNHSSASSLNGGGAAVLLLRSFTRLDRLTMSVLETLPPFSPFSMCVSSPISLPLSSSLFTSVSSSVGLFFFCRPVYCGGDSPSIRLYSLSLTLLPLFFGSFVYVLLFLDQIASRVSRLTTSAVDQTTLLHLFFLL